MEPFHIPRLRTMARNAVPHLIEGTLVPLGLFYLAMWLIGIWGAIALSLAWSWGGIMLRVVSRRRVPGLLVVGALGLTVRSVLSYFSGSVFLYFLQPTLGTVAVAGAFLLSVPTGRPMAARLAHDFLPMPEWFATHPAIRRFFLRISLLWGAIQLTNAGIALWLLLSQTITVYLAAKTVASIVIMGGAIAASSLWFRRLVDRHGLSTSNPTMGMT